MKSYLGRLLEVLGVLVLFSGAPKLRAELPAKLPMSLDERHRRIFLAVANDDVNELIRLVLRGEGFTSNVLEEANDKNELDIVSLSAKRGRLKTFQKVTTLIQDNLYDSAMRWSMERRDATYGRTALHWAVLSGNDQLMTEAYLLTLRYGDEAVTDKEAKAAFDYYPLTIRSAAKFPLDLADRMVNGRPLDPYRVYDYAAQGRWSGRLLAELRLRPNLFAESEGSTDLLPLHLAAQNDNVTAIKFIAKLAPATLAIKQNGVIPLATAVDSANKDAFDALYNLYPKGLDFLDADKNTLLHRAVESGRDSLIERLLKLKKSFAWKRNSKKEIPLHLAAQRNSAAAVFLAQEAPETLLLLNSDNKNPYQVAKDHDNSLADSLAEINPRVLGKKFDEILSNDRRIRAYLKYDPRFGSRTDAKGTLPLHLGSQWLTRDGMGELLKNYPAAITRPDENGSLPLHRALAAKNIQVAMQLFSAAPSTSAIADKEGNLPLHTFLKHNSLDTDENFTAFATLLLSNRQTIREKNKEGYTPVGLMDPSASRYEYVRDLEFLILNPDKRRRSRFSEFDNRLPFEVDHFAPNALESRPEVNDTTIAIAQELQSEKISELRYVLALGLSNCPTAFRFGSAAINPDHAVRRMAPLLNETLAATPWQDLPLSTRLGHLEGLLEIDTEALDALYGVLQEAESSGEILGFENRFALVVGAQILPNTTARDFCSRVSPLAKLQLEAYVSKVWASRYSRRNDLPVLAQILGIDAEELRIKGLSSTFLDENLNEDLRQRLRQSALQCVECHNKTDPDTDYPLSFKIGELGEAPTSPQSTSATLREEILRRIEMPDTNRGHMPKGRGERLSNDDINSLRNYLQSPGPRSQ